MTQRARRTTSFFGLACLALAITLFISRGFSGAVDHASGTGSALASDPGTLPSTLPYIVPDDFAVTMIRAGLDADALAAAGVGASGIVGVLQPAADRINQSPGALRSADTALATARRESERLKRLIESGKGRQEDVSAYQMQSQALATATASRQTILDGYFSAATAGMTEARRTALTRLRANRAWSLPREFMVVDRTQQEFVQVRDALANERISRKLGDTADAGNQASLANWRAHALVAAARASLDANRAGVAQAWRTATGD